MPLPASAGSDDTRTNKPFTLLVSIVGDKPEAFAFDQPRVLVGRGADADLRIEHAGISRRQFAIERGVGSVGEPRFRVTPFEATNPTYLNDHPAVEGTLVPGDVLAVADIRIVLERKVEASSRKKKEQISPLRAILLTATVAMAIIVLYPVLFAPKDDGAGEVVGASVQLFLDGPEPRCGNPVECDTRAHDAYTRGKHLFSQAAADPGNLYRATLEFHKAVKFREQSGRPLPDIADAAALEAEVRQRAEAEFADARFRLQRARAANDAARCIAEASQLALLVPDDNHPFRVRLDAYRRTLPKPQKKEEP